MNIIQNSEISITPEQWVELNQNHDKEYIKEMISDAIDQLPMPMRTITKEEAMDAFQSLKDLDEQSLFIDTPFFSRYDYKYDSTDTIIKSSSVGNKASDYFHQENRWKCDSINAPSPYRSWYIKKFRMTMLNALWSLKGTKVDTKTLRSCIALRKYIASQFRPSAAKAVYNKFESVNVLDFSSGWGDRLAGFCASNATSYTGIDPNQTLVQGYKDQIKMYGGNKTIDMNVGKAQEFPDTGNTYDTIFTSPPYYNIERYTQEEDQSFKEFRKFDDWMNKFMFATIDNMWDRLETSGHLILNISDVYSNHTINQICDRMNDKIQQKTGATYVGCIGYEMRKRPNSGALKDKVGSFAEPTWIWKKN